MFRLPVSGLGVTLRPPAGQEDILLQESLQQDVHLAVALLRRLVRPVNGGDLDLEALSVTDYETLLLRLHQVSFGDQITAAARCPREGCGETVGISFGVEEYLEHHRPRTPKAVQPAEKTEWYALKSEPVQYRLPNVGDLAAISGHPQPERELTRRCLQPPEPKSPVRQKVERAMESQAPSLSQDLEARCPACGGAFHFFFRVEPFVLRELKEQAAFIYQDTHLLALHYHWSEPRILAIPRNRRVQYVEMLREGL